MMFIKKKEYDQLKDVERVARERYYEISDLEVKNELLHRDIQNQKEELRDLAKELESVYEKNKEKDAEIERQAATIVELQRAVDEKDIEIDKVRYVMTAENKRLENLVDDKNAELREQEETIGQQADKIKTLKLTSNMAYGCNKTTSEMYALLKAIPEDYLATVDDGKLIYAYKSNDSLKVEAIDINSENTEGVFVVNDYAYPVIELHIYAGPNHIHIGNCEYDAARKEWTYDWFDRDQYNVGVQYRRI